MLSEPTSGSPLFIYSGYVNEYRFSAGDEISLLTFLAVSAKINKYIILGFWNDILDEEQVNGDWMKTQEFDSVK